MIHLGGLLEIMQFGQVKTWKVKFKKGKGLVQGHMAF